MVALNVLAYVGLVPSLSIYGEKKWERIAGGMLAGKFL